MSNFLQPYQKRYRQNLEQHIAYVQEAGNTLGVDKHLLSIHDASKWSVEEFTFYAAKFFGDGQTSVKIVEDDFARAWLHHIHYNPHHWEYWIFPDGYTSENSNVENGIIEMPYHYVLEMVADWMGSRKQRTGDFSLVGCMDKPYNNVKMHSNSWQSLYDILTQMGYWCSFDHLANRYQVLQSAPEKNPVGITGLQHYGVR